MPSSIAEFGLLSPCPVTNRVTNIKAAILSATNGQRVADHGKAILPGPPIGNVGSRAYTPLYSNKGQAKGAAKGLTLPPDVSKTVEAFVWTGRNPTETIKK